ncbi:MAG: DNA polymerase I, partial [Ruminiclostridium sp.]|nr:DNA polymerase I [Ruminiclostridium sp.]
MKLLVIDGNSIINRAFFAIKTLSNKKGVYTNAVTGFMNIYLKLIDKYAPDGAAAAFDLKAPTFRHKAYDGYKAGRRKMADELAMQMPFVKDILRALGVKVVECEGYEADDILGTLAEACERSGGECIIATGDRDSFQLITDKVYVNLASNKDDVLYTPAKIAEVYGVTPAEMLEVKAIMGDSSDNIPGVRGIGEKGALALIQQYHTIDNIYAQLDAIDVTESVRSKLRDGRESAELSRMLGTIVKNVPVETSPEHYTFGARDDEKLAEILTELEMFALAKKLKIPQSIMDTAAAKAADDEADDAADSTVPESAVREVPAFDESIPDYILGDFGRVSRYMNGKSEEADLSELSGSSPKRIFDLKSTMTALNCDIEGVVFDTTLAAYLLNVSSSEYTLEKLCAEYHVPFGDGGAETVHRLNA